MVEIRRILCPVDFSEHSRRALDLIVMGVQGRGAADLLFCGSTAQHVVREASCPVLTLRRGRPEGSA